MLAAQGDVLPVESLNLGLALVKAGRLTEADYNRVLRMQAGQVEGQSLATLLNRLGLVSEQDIAQQLSQLLGLPRVAASDFPTAPLLAERLSYRFLKECRALPLERKSVV